MKVASIVVGWNRRDDTVACLASLAGQSAEGIDHRLLLVDNGSTDDTVEAARRAVPDLDVVQLGANRGFAAGANAGIARALAAGAERTWLVNNDAVAPPELLGLLLAAMGDDVGLATPTVHRMDPPGTVWPSAGWRRGVTLAAFDTTASPPSSEPYDVDWATGCCLLVRAAVWREVGLFDPRYLFYYEDHDLCLRARAAGWRIVHVPQARVLHRVAASTGEGTPRQMYLLGRASVPYYWEHTRGLHRAFIVGYRLASLVRTLAESLASGRPGAGLAYLRGIGAGIADMAHPAANLGL